jgi:hypothetical protein
MHEVLGSNLNIMHIYHFSFFAYIPVCTSMYQIVPVHTSMYKVVSVHPCQGFYRVHFGTFNYYLVCLDLYFYGQGMK